MSLRKNPTTKNYEISDSDFTLFDSRKFPRRPSNNLTQMGKDLLIEREWDDDDRDDPFEPIPVAKINPKKTISKAPVQRYTGGKQYPIDLWFLLGSYIDPEDILRFALICRSANQVVRSATFWMRIFQKFDERQSRRFARILSQEETPIIRNYVIRSLYQVYPLFRSRWSKNEIIQRDPHFLVSTRCVRTWYSTRSENPSLFNYYFEFHSDQTKYSPSPKPISPLLQKADPISLDHQSIILHLVSTNFVPVGPVMGTILSNVQMPVSSNFLYHKLQLVFDSAKGKSSKSMCNKIVVTIDPVKLLKIYRWFDCPSNLE